APEWAPEQLFGWSNESNPLVSDERFDGRSIRDHMGTLVGRLRRFRDSVMQTQAMAVGLGGTPEHRRLASADALFAFPEELGRLAPNLETYLSTIFGSTSGSLRQLFLRGVYFTSARQDGVRLNQSLADIGIDATQLPAVATRSGERSFFLSELFGKKMFRERGLATSLKGDVHKTRAKLKARLAIFGMVSLTAVLALIGWFGFQLDASVGRQRSYWVALADAVERGGLGLIQSISGYEVRTAQPDVSSLDLIAGRGLTENATVGDIYQTAADRAGSDFDVPLVFEPASAFASDPESERRRAVRALVLSQALAPAAQQARRSLGAPSLEWRRFDAVTALIRLETLARRERPADEVVEEGAPALIPGEIDVLALASELVLEPSEGEDQHPSLTVLEQAADAVRRVLEDPDYERSALADDLTDHGVVLLEDPSGGSSAIDLENSLRRLEQALLSGELREILGLKDEAAAFESVASRLVRFEAAWDEVGRQIARPIETSAQAATLRADLARPVGTLVALGTELDGLEDRFTPARSFVSRFGTGAELSAFSAWGDAVAAWEGSLPTADENEAPEIAALRVRVASIGEAAQQAVVDRLQALVDGFRSDGGPGALLDFRAGASRRTYAARAASIAGAFERLGAAVDDHGLARDDRLGFASPGHLAATGPLLGPPERAPELAPGDPVAFVGSVAARQELANRAWRLIGRDPPGDEVGVQRVVDRLAASGYEQNVPALPYLDDVSPGDPRYSIPAASEVLGRWSGYLAALAAGSLDRSELSREVGGASDAFAGYASAFAGYWSGDGAYEAVRVEPGTVRRDTLGDLPRGSTVALELESFFAPARRVLEGLEPEGESSSAVELPSVDAAVVDRALRAWRDIGLRSNVDGWSRVVSQAMIDAVRRGDRDRDLLVESDPYTFSLERAFLILLDTRLRSGVDPEIAGLLSG
ncbi:MAG: type VI secretion system protein, partial [Planctomycetota bacterium]